MTIRVVVVGIGQQGGRHLRTLHASPDAEVVATVDPRVDGVSGIPHFETLTEAIDHASPDGVIVATPTERHGQSVLEALAADLPVLVEKPLARTAEEAEALVAAEARSRGLLVVGHVERFNPAVELVREMLRAGSLGVPIAFSFRRVGLPPARHPGINVIHDLAVHDVDVFHHLAGGFSELSGACGWPQGGMAESAHIVLQRGEVHGMVEVNWRTPVRLRSFTITTDQCFVEVNYTTQRIEVIQPSSVQDFEEFAAFQAHYGSARRTSLEPRSVEPLTAQLEAFISAIRSRVPGRLATGEAGLAAVKIADEATARIAQAARDVVRVSR